MVLQSPQELVKIDTSAHVTHPAISLVRDNPRRLTTGFTDHEVELWVSEAPAAIRNRSFCFIQLTERRGPFYWSPQAFGLILIYGKSRSIETSGRSVWDEMASKICV